MISIATAEMVKDHIGYFNAIKVYSTGTSGGMCLFSQEDIMKFDLVSFSSHHIYGDVTKGSLSWHFDGVYGWPDASNKCCTWELIHCPCEEATIPILLGGDFNEILSHEDKERGLNRERREVENFREALNRMGLKGSRIFGPMVDVG